MRVVVARAHGTIGLLLGALLVTRCSRHGGPVLELAGGSIPVADPVSEAVSP